MYIYIYTYTYKGFKMLLLHTEMQKSFKSDHFMQKYGVIKFSLVLRYS